MKDVWLKKVARVDKFNTENVGVCILHFEMKYIKTMNEKGISLKRARLTNDAYPTIFNFEKDGFGDVLNKDLIGDFMNFKNLFATEVKATDWLTRSTESYVTFFKLHREKIVLLRSF